MKDLKIIDYDWHEANRWLAAHADVGVFSTVTNADEIGLGVDTFNVDTDSGELASLLDTTLAALTEMKIWRVALPGVEVSLVRYATLAEPGIEMMAMVHAAGAMLITDPFGVEEIIDGTSGILAATVAIGTIAQAVNELSEHIQRLLCREPLENFCGYCQHHVSAHTYERARPTTALLHHVPCSLCVGRQCLR